MRKNEPEPKTRKGGVSLVLSGAKEPRRKSSTRSWVSTPEADVLTYRNWLFGAGLFEQFVDFVRGAEFLFEVFAGKACAEMVHGLGQAVERYASE